MFTVTITITVTVTYNVTVNVTQAAHTSPRESSHGSYGDVTTISKEMSLIISCQRVKLSVVALTNGCLKL